MRALISFLGTLIVIAFLICVVVWIFSTDFLIFDILLLIGIISVIVVLPVVLLLIVIWAILEVFY